MFQDKRIDEVLKQNEALAKQVGELQAQVTKLQEKIDHMPIPDNGVRRWVKEGLKALHERDAKAYDHVMMNL